MTDLWVYDRRPASMVRHRHGGFNATFPMNSDTVVEQADRALAIKAARDLAEQADIDPPPRIEGYGAHNILRFQPRSLRTKRTPAPLRPTCRPPPYRE